MIAYYDRSAYARNFHLFGPELNYNSMRARFSIFFVLDVCVIFSFFDFWILVCLALINNIIRLILVSYKIEKYIQTDFCDKFLQPSLRICFSFM